MAKGKKFTKDEKASAYEALKSADETVSAAANAVEGASPEPDGNFDVADSVVNELFDATTKIKAALTDLGGKPCGGGRPC